MNIWTAVYHHRHGVNTYLFANQEPTVEQVVARIAACGEEFEPEREDEFIDIDGPETICGESEKLMGVMITTEQKTEYIENACCPICRSGNIDGEDGGDWDTEPIIHGIRCLDCKAVWDDVYRLVDIVAQFNAPSCARCNSQLTVDGKCSDETCLFSDTDQDDERGWVGHPDH